MNPVVPASALRAVKPPASQDVRLKGVEPAGEAGAHRGCGDDNSSTDASAVAAVPHTRGCGEVDGCETAVAERSTEQTAGEMTEEIIPDVPRPAEFHNQIISGEWTDCGEDEREIVNYGIASGNWGGSFPKNQAKQDWMVEDVFETPTHVFCFQEAE